MVGQFRQVFEEYPMTFKDIKGKKKAPITMLLPTEGNHYKYSSIVFCGCGQLFADLRFWWGLGTQTSAKFEGGVYLY